MKLFFSTIILIVSLSFSTHADHHSNVKPENNKTNAEKVTDNLTKGPDGTKYPEGGPAKPVENWFGCKPGSNNCKVEDNPRADPEDRNKDNK